MGGGAVKEVGWGAAPGADIVQENEIRLGGQARVLLMVGGRGKSAFQLHESNCFFLS